ncbi:MAG: Ig-like domain-containing protein [Firmicutes bacterium]|nr:Ig-like domain-containing protein [Bacillota bacterium]
MIRFKKILSALGIVAICCAAAATVLAQVDFMSWRWEKSLAYKKAVTTMQGSVFTGSSRDFLVDGDVSTFTRLGTSALGSDRWTWFKVDLGEAKDADYFKVFTHQVYSNEEFKSNSFIETIKIDGSTDNESFQTIIPESSYSAEVGAVYPADEVFEFFAAQKHNVRWVRIWVRIQDEVGDGKARVPSLRQFGVYNTSDFEEIVYRYERKLGDGQYEQTAALTQGTMRVSAEVYGASSYAGREIMVVAGLFEGGNMKHLTFQKGEITAGLLNTISVEIDVPESRDHEIRAFVWNADTLMPLCSNDMLQEAVISELAEYMRSDRLWEDKEVGTNVRLNIYSKTAASPEGGSPVILYIMNHAEERIGQESDLSIISDFIDDGYIVITADYMNNPKAAAPVIDFGIMNLRVDVINSRLYTGTDLRNQTNGQDVNAFVVPAGYRLARDLTYFEMDKHSSFGTLERVMELYNRESYIVQKSGLPKVSTPSQMVRKDGSPIDYKLRMDITYPSQPKKVVPILMYQNSTDTRRGIESYISLSRPRPHYIGFLMRGYTFVNYDHNYNPLERYDHFGFQSGATYGLDRWNGRKTNTAAVRFVRYQADLLGYDATTIGMWGNSKGSYGPAILLDPNHVGKPERATFDGFPDGTPEEQPWLGYSSAVTAGYYSMGDGTTNHATILTDDYLPTIIACGQNDESNWPRWPGLVADFESRDIPHLALAMEDRGHETPTGYDSTLSLDRYKACFDYLDRYLRVNDNLSPMALYVMPADGATEIDVKELVTVKFVPDIDAATVTNGENIKITRVDNGETVSGSWQSFQRGTLFKWTPTDVLDLGTEYRITLTTGIKDKLGRSITEGITRTFKTKLIAEKTLNLPAVANVHLAATAAQVGNNDNYYAKSATGRTNVSNAGADETVLSLSRVNPSSTSDSFSTALSYMQFDISGLSAEERQSIANVSLTLTAYAGNKQISVFKLNSASDYTGLDCIDPGQRWYGLAGDAAADGNPNAPILNRGSAPNAYLAPATNRYNYEKDNNPVTPEAAVTYNFSNTPSASETVEISSNIFVDALKNEENDFVTFLLTDTTNGNTNNFNNFLIYARTTATESYRPKLSIIYTPDEG